MRTMACDKTGSTTGVGTLYTLAKKDVKAYIIGIITTDENAVSDKAYKPSDIILSMERKTIEVGNTNNEGKLIHSNNL